MEKSVVEWLEERIKERVKKNPNKSSRWHIVRMLDDFEKAKQMEKEKKILNKFNNFLQFLETEKSLGISDLKTIERIEWYYNTYYNETIK